MALTYYLRNVSQASGVHVADVERTMETTTTSPVSNSASIAAGASELSHVFTTLSGEPGIAQWGSGTYSAELNVSSAGADLTFGVRTMGGAGGHFGRVDSGLTTDLETVEQAEAAFSGTGIKTATASWTPSAGATDNRFEVVIAATNVGSMNQSLQLTVNTTDSEVVGPFDEGGVAPARTPQRTTTGVGT